MNSINEIIINYSVGIIDLLYKDRPFQRFWVLETIARAPYFSFLSVLHFKESLGLRGDSHLFLMEEHFKQSVNETEHLEIMESRNGNEHWVDRFFAYHLVLIYYWAMVFYYLFLPVYAYDFNVRIEEHAVHTYSEYLKLIDPSDAQIIQIMTDEQNHVKELKNAQKLIII